MRRKDGILQPERRFAELRHDPAGRILEGRAIKYGDVARLPWGRETFAPGAFGDLTDADVILNAMHERSRPLVRTGGAGLELRDSTAELVIYADLPATREADDVLLLVRSKVMRGLSLEFRAVAETVERGVRVVQRAALVSIAVVDKPAYLGSEVSARHSQGPPRRRRWFL